MTLELPVRPDLDVLLPTGTLPDVLRPGAPIWYTNKETRAENTDG